MSLAKVYSRAQLGMDAPLVTVEVHLSNGLPAFNIVGLPETAVKESKDRVRSAIINSNFEFPARRITVNLAPADLRKEGSRYDLAIAIGVLVAAGHVNTNDLGRSEFVGELSLNGSVREVNGVLPATVSAKQCDHSIYVALGNTEEAVLAGHQEVFGADHLLQVTAQLAGQQTLYPARPFVPDQTEHLLDLADVRGQSLAKRSLEVAAAGGHNLLFVGPPGTGKTMLASRLPGLLPQLVRQEALEVAALYSITSGGFSTERWALPPFRSPHHSASSVALVGGGHRPKPGEISLAHRGVLFLDELPEFDRSVLEQLREPMETGAVNISRAAQHVQFPARFQLVAAMNPCPCGWLGEQKGRCRCTEDQIRKYRSRISGPLLDRIDIHVEVPPIPRQMLRCVGVGESSRSARCRVQTARNVQLSRGGCLNQDLDVRQTEDVCRLDEQPQQLLDQAMDRLGLSTRVYHRILRVARTISDLDGRCTISEKHISEAIGYRLLDRDAFH